MDKKGVITGNSRSVSSNQQEVHDKLPELVTRYLASDSQKPIQQHTLDAFEQVSEWLNLQLKAAPDSNIILDSCCGVGESTWRLAKENPNALVIGVDKSFDRLQKHGQQLEYKEYSKGPRKSAKSGSKEHSPVTSETVFHSIDNYCVSRADVIDFWRMVQQQSWNITQHFIFYPNPYPKASQLQKRWHGCQSFKDIVNIGGELTVRSNWKIYIQEFALALEIAGKTPSFREVEKYEPFTPFERKYWNSGQNSWQVVCKL